ncbi:hypothetical protein BOTBODRAFT_184282 [Botryobasidium botryosum FD-172 SS1]|uniref:Thioredoxin domain-containing protein n=1 Tax=Botryobasidium botryosum (strain FD-172 SS1) TaxID=930990 RepID=A0A067N9C4_BOTB1|nr:hypothetical protein BOTBODRAFT_184282 [Botryobasidium botryosum FD-172 SS1]
MTTSPTFSADAPVTEAQFDAAAAINVIDEQGNRVPFGSLYENQKTVVVFIRHFFCCICRAYTTQLNGVPAAALEAAGVRLVIIGCGDHSNIGFYKEKTGYAGGIYVDPSRDLYAALGMTLRNLKFPPSETTPTYFQKNPYWAAACCSWDTLRQKPMSVLKGEFGDVKQLGGDFVLGPGNQCVFAHRMENVQDHIEVVDLMKYAGIDI